MVVCDASGMVVVVAGAVTEEDVGALGVVIVDTGFAIAVFFGWMTGVGAADTGACTGTPSAAADV